MGTHLWTFLWNTQKKHQLNHSSIEMTNLFVIFINLLLIFYINGQQCGSSNTCDEGEGNCDSFYDCKGNLVCGNNCKQFGRFYNAQDSCCQKPRCKGRNFDKKGRGCCTRENPCHEGEGDCESPLEGGGHNNNEDCKGDLVCGSNNCKKFNKYYHIGDDCCEKRSPSPTPTPTTPSLGRCTPTSPCVEGEGYCDSFYDCRGNLVCGNNCEQFGSYYNAQDSCCQQPRCKGRHFGGGRGCCTPVNPCNEGEGDCEAPEDGGGHNNHKDCKGDLVSRRNNCNKKFASYYHIRDDCCEKPPPGQTTITTTKPAGCKTIGGDDPGKSCIFPFSFNGRIYRGCTLVG